MTLLLSLLPKLVVFAIAAAIGGTGTYLGVSAARDRTPVSTAGEAPEFLMAGAPDSPGGEQLPAAFNVEPVPGVQPAVLSALPPEDLALAAEALLGAEPVTVFNPSGYPRIPPVTQFDGGPFANANCTLASGAMLARLTFGIVTTGSILRTLQDDQDGGTGLDDLSTALWRGYGVSMRSGLVRPDQLKSLLAAGYGAVIQGDYSRIPAQLRLQPSFTGSHAVYVDGWYAGDAAAGIPEAYFIIDPLGRPNAGYEGEWWPASVVDAFGTTFGGGRIPAMWGYPPGGVAPDVIGPDVLPIPAGGTGGEPGATPGPGDSPAPSETPPIVVEEAGDVGVPEPPGPPPMGGGEVVIGGRDLLPVLEICLVEPRPAGCPRGIEGVFDVVIPPIGPFEGGPTIAVRFVDSDRPNMVFVGFTLDPPSIANVRFWKADGSDATVHSAHSMTSVTLSGTPTIVARLNVLAGTQYQFQVVAGDGSFASTSPIGSFTSGGGVSRFDVALSSVSRPKLDLGTSLSPYLRLASDSFVRPLLSLDVLGGSRCSSTASFGGLDVCLDIKPAIEVPTCTRAQVRYELTGVGESAVLVRAFPTVVGIRPRGDTTLAGVLEAEGPAGSGTVSIGCLSSGLTYYIVIDAIGDSAGVLASEEVTIP